MSIPLLLTTVLSGALATPVSQDVPPNTPTFLIPYAIAFRETVWHVCSYIKEGADIIAQYLPASVNSFLKEVISVLSLLRDGTRSQLIVASIVFCFMCSWISAYPYLHYKPSGRSKMDVFEARFTRMIMGVLAPDAIAMTLARYNGTAVESLKSFNEKIFPQDTKNGWTMTHAHFSLLNGFELDRRGDMLEGLSLAELATLILKKEVDLPEISVEDIRVRTTGGSRKSTKWLVSFTFFWFALKFRRPQEFDLLRELVILFGYFTVYSSWISSGQPFTVVEPFRVTMKPKLKHNSEETEKEEGIVDEPSQDKNGTSVYPLPDVDLEEAQLSSKKHPIDANNDRGEGSVLVDEERDENLAMMLYGDIMNLYKIVISEWQDARGVAGTFLFIFFVTFVHVPLTVIMMTISVFGQMFVFVSIIFASLVSPLHNIWDLMICPVLLPAVIGNALGCWIINIYWGMLIRATGKVQFKTELEGRLWAWSIWFILLQPIILVCFSNRRFRARFNSVLKKSILFLYSLLYVVARLTVFFLAFYTLRRV